MAKRSWVSLVQRTGSTSLTPPPALVGSKEDDDLGGGHQPRRVKEQLKDAKIDSSSLTPIKYFVLKASYLGQNLLSSTPVGCSCITVSLPLKDMRTGRIVYLGTPTTARTCSETWHKSLVVFLIEPCSV